MSIYNRFVPTLRKLGITQRAIVYTLEGGPLGVFDFQLEIDQHKQGVINGLKVLKAQKFVDWPLPHKLATLTEKGREWLTLAPPELRPAKPGKLRAYFPTFGLRQRQLLRLIAREDRTIYADEISARLGLEAPGRLLGSLVWRGVIKPHEGGFALTKRGRRWSTIDRGRRGLA